MSAPDDVMEAGTTLSRREHAAIVHGTEHGAVQRLNETPSRVMGPTELIQFAIENKLPAAELKELVALHEQMTAREAAREFNRALADFQRATPPIKKGKTAKITTKGGGSYSFSYAEFDEIEAHVKPYLERFGFSYTFDTTVDDKGVLLTNTCTLLHENGHSRSSKFTLPIANESGMSPQQKVGAANSYAKRQTLSAVLGLNITDKEVPDDEVDPTTIGEDQAIEIEDLIRESGINRQKFFEWLDVDSSITIRRADYPRAIATLRDRIAKKQERAQ